MAAEARPIQAASAESPLAQQRATPAARWTEIQKRRVGTAPVLRWQEPRVASATTKTAVIPASSVSEVSAMSTLAWGTDSNLGDSRGVQLAAQLGPVDPFDDPFGDREAESNHRSILVAPIAIQPPFSEELLPDQPPRPEPRIAPDDLPAEPAPDFMPPDNRLDSPPDELAPAPPRGFPYEDMPPATPDKPCDRIYNNRNCCEEVEECQHARRMLRELAIDKISLNISPLIKPDADSPEEAEHERALRLAQSEIRTWRNRQGEVVARGQITDLQFGRAYIETDGETKKVPVADLSDDDRCFLAAWWGVPTECPLPDEEYKQREWLASTMTWKASALCHKPLYFEEVQLERYGHTAHPLVQPALSGAHFFLNIAALPYKMGINPPNECRYALGYYRPGSCAPWLLPPFPLSLRGGLMEAGAIVGGIYIIP